MYIGYSSTIAIERIVEKLIPKNDAVIQWYTQSGNITNNSKVNIDFNLPELIATNAVTWKFHVNDSTNCR